MFQETYNYRYLLQLSFTQTSDKNDDINRLMYLNLMDACVGRDELSLYNNLLQNRDYILILKTVIYTY